MNLFLDALLFSCFLYCFPDAVFHNLRLLGYTYRNLSFFGVKHCAKECLTEPWCKSFNYNRNNFSCELNYGTVGYSVTSNEYVFSNKSDWSLNIAGTCSSKVCNVNEKCVILKSGSPECLQIAFCVDPTYKLANRTNICYKVVEGIYLNWTAADNYCKNQSGRLITMDTKEKAEYIHEEIIAIKTTGKVWIGLTDVQEERTFVWSNGNKLTYDKFWGTGQPNDVDSLCVNNETDVDYVEAGVVWNDRCNSRALEFVCETEVKYIVGN